MRSRPDLKVLLSGVGVPGQPLVVDARFRSKTETPVEFVDFLLEGGERNGDQVRLFTHVNLGRRELPKVFTPGEHRFRVRFDLPPGIPPTYRGQSFGVLYELTVHASIPWWPDLRARYDVPVAPLPVKLGPEASQTFCNDELAPAAGRPYIEASFESRSVALGEPIVGAASFSNMAHLGVRAVRVEIVGRELPVFGVQAGHRYAVVIHEGAPPDAVPIPFRVRIPATETANFTGRVRRLEWAVEICAVGTWGAVASLHVPLQVYASAVGAPAPRGRVLPVGRDRRALVFGEVARRSGLALDPDGETLRGTAGDVKMVIRLESRGAATATVAHYEWPSLGLDLHVGEHGLADALLHAPVLLPGGKLAARGREKAQVEGWLATDLSLALAEIPEVHVHDEGARIAWGGGAQGVRELDHFVTRAQALLAALARSNAAVPPPALGAAAVAAWRAFAERTGGHFAPGPMAVRDAHVGTERCDLEVVWAFATKAVATRATLFLEPPLPAAPQEDSATLSPLARELLREARALPEVILAADRFGLALPGLVADPAELEPKLELLGRLARAARGLEGQGPFR